MSFADLFFPLADMAVYWWVPILAVILDAMTGDPPKWPHPVRYIGALCAVAEPFARRLPGPERLGGGIAVCLVLAATWASVRLLLLFPTIPGIFFAVYLAFAGLARGQLLREGKAALALLEQHDVESARVAIGLLVSRDVSQSDHTELCRVLAETLAENLNDAFVAPLFWLVVGGPVGLWLYKAASTMDSMWGYPYGPWTRFGTAAARLDDVLAYVPARLTALLLHANAVLTRIVSGGRGNGPDAPLRSAIKRTGEDAKKMKSPNAGWPMASCAWLHNAAMGGRAVYDGKIVEKPILGPSGTIWTTAKLASLCRDIVKTGFTGTAVLCLSGWFLWTMAS